MKYTSHVYIVVVVLVALGLTGCANDTAPEAAGSPAPAVEQSDMREGYTVDPY